MSAHKSPRLVALHADDLGMNPAVTDGIFQAFQQGLLTSTSLLSNAPDAARALDRWRQLEADRAAGTLPSLVRRQRLHDPRQPFDLGIHLNLTQGRPLTAGRYPAELLDARGCFPSIFSLFHRLRKGGAGLAAAVQDELTCQVQFMLDRGQRPTHLNGHQYIEMLPVAGPMVEWLLETFHIPTVRVAWEPSWWSSFLWPGISTTQWLLGGVKKMYAGRFGHRMLAREVFFADAFLGTMTAGTMSLETVRAFLATRRDFQLAEIGMHPAAAAAEKAAPADGWSDPLAHLRPRELDLLCSAELEELLVRSDCRLGRLGSIPQSLESRL